MPRSTLLLVLLALILFPRYFSAQQLVANLSQGNAGSDPVLLQSNDNFTLFLANDGTGEDAYYLPAAASEPARVSDLLNGQTLGWVNHPVLIGNRVYYATDGGGVTHYRSADLMTGEVEQMASLPAAYFYNHDPRFIDVNGVIVFVHVDRYWEDQLYGYDVGDKSLKILQQLPDNSIERIVRLDDRILINYGYSWGEPVPFVVTDGTMSGTFERYLPEGTQYISSVAAVGARTIVQTLAGPEIVPFVYDAHFTEALPLREVFPSIPPGTARDFDLRGDALYFSLAGSDLDFTIYRMDTATRMIEPVLDMNPARDSVYVGSVQYFGDRVFYKVNPRNSTTLGLFSAVQNAEGRLLLDGIARSGFNGYSLGDVVASDGSFYFLADRPDTGTELWRTDGTPAGTRMVADLFPGPSSPDISVPLPGRERILFTAEHPEYGREIFGLRDGSEVIELLQDLNVRETGSFPMPLTAVNDRLLLSASTPCTGFELFSTQGSAATTVLVEDFCTGRESSHPRVNEIIGDTAYLRVFAGKKDLIYGSDGSATGTFVLDPDGRLGEDPGVTGPTRLGDRLLVRAFVPGVGQGLYSIDPPTGAYELIKLFESNFGGSDSGPGFVALNDSILLFDETTEAYGTELWRTDGTAEGTYLLKDIRRVEESGYYGHIGQLSIIDGIAYFSADYGTGRRLFRSDGTEAGTYELTGSGDLRSPGEVFAYAGRVYFVAGNGSRRLYTTAGAPNDVLASRITASTAFSSLENVRVLRERLVFTASREDTGNELWSVAGPEATPELLRDFEPGPESSYPWNLFVVNDTLLLLSATTLESGRELWKTNGTVAGTVQVADLWSGPGSSDPMHFFAFDGFVYFAADDGKVGAELWRYAPDGVYPELGKTDDVPLSCSGAPTSTQDRAGTSIRVFPNPTSEWLHVEISESQPVRASLHTLNGRTVYAADRTGDRITIPLHGLPPGTYVLLLRKGSSEILDSRHVVVAR